ncbi:hypothetical protein [Negativibacillus massiliensis]|uniref:hypothetical protein n=1 Tax=Negativibacillus massiliensis TaxID=1871035 RepID=UPI003AF6D4D8
MNLLIWDRKKYIPALILCLAVLICMIIVMIFNSSSDSETTLPGTWICLDQPEIQMEIKENLICMNGLSFPYELSLPLVSSPTRQQPQAFVLDAGSMGVMGGLFFFEDNNLYLEIDSQVRIFSRVQP